MDVLNILLVTFAILYSLDRFAGWGLSFAGRAAMAMMLFVTGTAHFTSTDSSNTSLFSNRNTLMPKYSRNNLRS